MNLSFGFLWTMMAITRPESAEQAGRMASGLYAWADEAGRLVEAPAADLERTWVPWEIENALSTSHEGLVEITHPSGASGLDLRGRFHHGLFATVDASGQARYGHEMQPVADREAAPAERDEVRP